jgi:hypothetical protein
MMMKRTLAKLASAIDFTTSQLLVVIFVTILNGIGIGITLYPHVVTPEEVVATYLMRVFGGVWTVAIIFEVIRGYFSRRRVSGSGSANTR